MQCVLLKLTMDHSYVNSFLVMSLRIVGIYFLDNQSFLFYTVYYTGILFGHFYLLILREYSQSKNGLYFPNFEDFFPKLFEKNSQNVREIRKGTVRPTGWFDFFGACVMLGIAGKGL